jgi:predicted nucleotidyltransferase
MTAVDDGSVQQRFGAALDALVDEIKRDRSVLAAILCGSLSHDKVWDKSDIDLLLVTVDDRKVEVGGRALYANGVNVHALLVPRTKFRQMAEGAVRNSFTHAFLAKGRLLYSHDPTIADLCGDLGAIGARDTDVQLLAAGIEAVGPIYKAHKWFRTRADLEYTALWILCAAFPLAKIEVVGARRIADREVIPQATALNPSLFKTIYTDLLNSPKTAAAVEAALAAVDRYVAERAPALFAPVLAYLREVGEARSVTEIEDYFERHYGVEGVTAACEYLADQGLIGKAATPVQLTKRSNVQVQELAFFHADVRSDRHDV